MLSEMMNRASLRLSKKSLVRPARGKTPNQGMQGLGRISAQLDLSMNILEAKTDAGQYLLVGEQMVQELAPVANLAVLKDELQGDVFMEQTLSCTKKI